MFAIQGRTPLHQPDETPQPSLQEHEPIMPATPLPPVTLAPPTPNPYAPPMLSPPQPAPTPVPPHTPLPMPMTPASMGIQEDLSHLGIPHHQASQDMIAQGRNNI